MGEMSVMDVTEGDVKVIWDPEVEAEVAVAEAQFDTLRGKGYMAYAVTGRGEKGQQIRTFDPEAEKIILAPALQGG